MKKIAYFVQFPIHYQVPLLQELSKKVDLTVFYISDLTTKEFNDKGFGNIKWNVDLLEGYKYKILNIHRDNGVFSFFNPIVSGVKEAILSENWDAIWLHGYAHYALIEAFLLAKFYKIPILFRMESNLISTKRGFFKDKFMKFIMNNSKALLWISSDNKAYYKYYNVSEDKLFFCPYAVNNDYFQSKSKEFKSQVTKEKKLLGLKEDTKIILYASKLQKRKNPMELLIAYHKIIKNNPNSALVYIGTGEEETNLIQYVEKNSLHDNVKFLGFKNQDILPLYYEMCDIFVLPSNKEPFGMVIPEILNFAKPVITTTEVGSAKDLIINNENGFIIEPNNIELLSEKIEILLNDDKLRERMGEQSLKIINKWSYKEDIEGILKALE